MEIGYFYMAVILLYNKKRESGHTLLIPIQYWENLGMIIIKEIQHLHLNLD
jgi:hypothetical protein